MLSLFVRPLRSAAAVLLANDSPRQVALAAALGMVLGLVPKGNLIAMSLLVLLCAVQLNKTAGLMSAAFFSWVGPLLDGPAHLIGEKLLGVEAWQPTFVWLYELPIGPWIGFNNTVVLGSLILGLYLTYPCYLAMRAILDRVQGPVATWLRRYRVARWLLGADLSARFGAPVLGAGS